MHERETSITGAQEDDRTELECLIEQIPSLASRPLLEQLYESNGRSLDELQPHEVNFLKALYAARISTYDPRYGAGEDAPQISISEISNVFERGDPEIFERLEDEIAFVVEYTALDE